MFSSRRCKAKLIGGLASHPVNYGWNTGLPGPARVMGRHPDHCVPSSAHSAPCRSCTQARDERGVQNPVNQRHVPSPSWMPTMMGLAANGPDSEHRGGLGDALLAEFPSAQRLGFDCLSSVLSSMKRRGVDICLYQVGIPIHLIRADSGTSTAKRGPRSTRHLARRRQPLASPENRLWERD